MNRPALKNENEKFFNELANKNSDNAPVDPTAV
jgi:hypothetical protein